MIGNYMIKLKKQKMINPIISLRFTYFSKQEYAKRKVNKTGSNIK